MGQKLILGTAANSIEFDVDAAFPNLPAGHIYLAISGGIESTIILYLLCQRYPLKDIVPGTIRFEDGRRSWEAVRGKQISTILGVGNNHISSTYGGEYGSLTDPNTAEEYFRVENALFDKLIATDSSFVAGFTGKNTTALDPIIITPEEQEKYLIYNRVHRPLMKMDKAQTVDLYYKLGVEWLLAYTHTCTTRGSKHCGTCFACMERVDGFNRLGKKDPAPYAGDYEKVAARVRDHLPSVIAYELQKQKERSCKY